jgi:hypothetical protein
MRVQAVGLLLMFICSNSLAAGQIGSVSENRGSACDIIRNKNKLSGIKGSSVESMDTYTTGACSSSITFKDDTKVKITENSRLLIDDFVYDPKNSDAGKLAIKVAMGTVRYASGQISKNNPQQVSVKTPTANIAVRGTDFTMTIDETGQSLIVLLPSCKDEKDIKTYELEENKCKVGQIDVSTSSGTVTLDKAFEATYVLSANSLPTAPTVINTTESKIGNGLIIAPPTEVVRAIKDSTGKTKKEELDAEIEADAQRRLAQRVKENQERIDDARMLQLYDFAKVGGCNATTSVCVAWEKPDASDMQSRGKGTAFRNTENDHYAEIKTQGYSSNTIITVVHNDMPASTIIGDGSAGGNMVYIKQNTGVLRRMP